MIAKKTKILALAVVGMMCAVAIVGAAYAAFAGTASTYNENNSAEAGYIKMTPGTTAAGDWTSITASSKAVFDSYVFNGGSVYYFNVAGESGTGDAAGYTVKELTTATKVFTIENQSGAAITAINFAVKSARDVGNADFKYFLKVTSTNGLSGNEEVTNIVYIDISTTGSDADLDLAASLGNTGSTTVIVAICVGYESDYYVPDSHIGVAITNDAYAALDADAKLDYDQQAKSSSVGAPAGFADLDLAFTITDATA